jgi:predicted esterase
MAKSVDGSCLLDRIVETGEEPRRSTLIGLHDENSTHTEILPLLREVSDGRQLIAPRSARWSRFGGGGRFSWFSCVTPPLIEPTGFGDGLIQLERLLLDHAAPRDSAQATVILGIGQGATMALALAALWPELVAGVVAIGGSWPIVPGWTIPRRDMSGLRVLLVAGTDLARERLCELRADMSEIARRDDVALATAIRHWISDEPSAEARRI